MKDVFPQLVGNKNLTFTMYRTMKKVLLQARSYALETMNKMTKGGTPPELSINGHISKTTYETARRVLELGKGNIQGYYD